MLDSWIKSSVFELGTGGDFMYVSRLLPGRELSKALPRLRPAYGQFHLSTSATTQAPRLLTGPDAPVASTVILPIEQYTPKVDKRFRARSVQIGIEATEVGTLWQLRCTAPLRRA
jgi:hypothetical protein